jgi:hypothetical protein
MIPIMVPMNFFAKSLNTYLENFNDAEVVGACLWLLKECQEKINYSKHMYIRGFITNGSEWKLYEVHESLVKKTIILKPDTSKLVNGFKATIADEMKLIDNIIGLIRFSLNIEENVILRSSTYKLEDDSQHELIRNKDVIQQKEDNIPFITEPKPTLQLSKKNTKLLH